VKLQYLAILDGEAEGAIFIDEKGTLFGDNAVMLITGAVLSFSGLMLNGLGLLPRMIIKMVCFVSFPFILYVFNFYEPVELESIRGFINKWSKIKNLKSNLNSLKGITDDL